MSKKSILPHPKKALKNSNGVALLIAMFSMTMLTFIALEVGYDTSVDYVVASQQVNRVKAYYAAKSGIEISLLRIKLYKMAVKNFGEALKGNLTMLDPIWSFPFSWPPPPMGNMSEFDKDRLKDASKQSLMKAQFVASISPEGGGIDINDLGSEIQALKKAMIEQVVKIFQNELQTNDAFRDKYNGIRFNEIVNNIADYVDEDSESLNGGDESSPYRDVTTAENPMPPNRPFRTVDELHQVAGMTDDFYNLLAPRITVFGTKGINVNYAPKEVLMALDRSMTEEAVQKVMARRSDPRIGGPFKDANDLLGFLSGLGVNSRSIQEAKVPLLFGTEYNFRIVSTGVAANSRREITAVTYDYVNLAPSLATLLDQQYPVPPPAGGTPQTPTPGSAPAPTADTGSGPKQIIIERGRPDVVYWEEN